MKRRRPNKKVNHNTKQKKYVPGKDAIVVTKVMGDMDLAHFIAKNKKLSIRAVKRELDSGHAKVNGVTETFGSKKVRAGDVIEFFMAIKDKLDHDFERKRLLHNKDGIIAYDKPAGLPVVPSGGKTTWCLEKMLKEKIGEVYPVHRIDADTSGVVLFATEKVVAEELEESFREREFEKSYMAIVKGVPPETGESRSYLVCTEKRKGVEKWKSGKGGASAVYAVTSWKVEEVLRGGLASIVRVFPLTGRFHQIRIHMSELGCPLLGDRIYGDRQDPVPIFRHMLHAQQIKNEKAKFSVSARLPQDFKEIIDKIRRM